MLTELLHTEATPESHLTRLRLHPSPPVPGCFLSLATPSVVIASASSPPEAGSASSLSASSPRRLQIRAPMDRPRLPIPVGGRFLRMKALARGIKRKNVGSSGSEKAAAKRRRMVGLGLLDVPRPIRLGRRSCKNGKPWTCTSCGTVNQPSRHLFVHLPAFNCSKCDSPPVRVDFRFSFGNLAVNDVCPIGKIYNQRKTGDCLIFAIAKACEITARIVHFLSGSQRNVKSLDPYSLRQNLIDARLAAGVKKEAICLFDDEAKDTMLELLGSAGIKEQNGEHIYKMKSERIRKDFETVAMTLADGYPLLVDFIPGSNFGNMGYRRVYKGPYSSQKTLPEIVVSHSVVLVGAARSGMMDFYYFVNSYGLGFCVRVNSNGRQVGGIGKVRAQDILNRPYKFPRRSLELEEAQVVNWNW